MTQKIDPIKLKAAAEHLEWVLTQYPDSDDVQGLLQSLRPLIDDAKAGNVLAPMDGMKIPGAYNFADGRYVPYTSPRVGSAYTDFVNEMEGGLTEQDKQRIARMDAMRRALMKGSLP